MPDDTASVIADAIATGFDRIITKLTNVLARHDAELAEMRDDLLALSNRIESVARRDNALRKVEE